jgi:hypothetical protein
MTFRDLMALFYGMPEALNQMRDHLRNFARERVLPSGGDFSDPSVRQGIMTLVNQAMPLLQSAAVGHDLIVQFYFILIELYDFRPRLAFVPMLILSPLWPSLSNSVFTK